MTQADSKGNQLPPMVKGLPILGNTLDAMRDIAGMLVNAYHEHGPVFRISRFGKQVYMLAGVEANEFYLANQDTHFYSADVYQNMTRESGTPHYFNALDGPAHRHLRRQMQPGFSRQQVADKIPDLIESTRTEARQWSLTEPVDALSTLAELLLRQAGSAMLGYETDKETAQSLDIFIRTFMGTGAGIMPHILTKRPAYQRGKQRFIGIMDEIIEEHQAQPAASGCPMDLIDIALTSTYGPDDDKTLNMTDVRATIYYPYVMNSVYTNRTVSYLLYELLHHPAAMARVMAEIDAVLTAGEPNLIALQRMTVMRAAIKEILRLYPLVAVVGRHAKKAF